MPPPGLGWPQLPADYGGPFPPEGPSETAFQAIHSPVEDHRQGHQPPPVPSASLVPYPYDDIFSGGYHLASPPLVPNLDLPFTNPAAIRPQGLLAAAAQDTGGDGFYAAAAGASSSTDPTSFGGTTYATGSSWGGPGNGKGKEPQRRINESNHDGSLISATRQDVLSWACPFLLHAMMQGGIFQKHATD
ncbi:uncharacterized protein PG998_012972 [Apiospora kogelbergensis]|uniref:uncharacterized protein n=1 Tax=Apiospora kogelbergensis TaxID=1337665 RepID=UPI00312CEE59